MNRSAAAGLRFWLCILPLCLLARPATAVEAETNAPPLLRKGDAILIDIQNLGGDMPEYREIVDSDGRIELPFLGFFFAEGKSIAAVETEMAAAYANAKLASNAVVRIVFIMHFDPPPPRSNLIRVQDPRRPVPAAAPPGSGPLR